MSYLDPTETVDNYTQIMTNNLSHIIGSLPRMLEEEEDNPTTVHLLLFAGVGLLVGSLLKHVKNWTSLPYSPIVLAFGIIIGIVHERISHVDDIIRLVNSIEPHTLLVIFIPCLVFESAYNTDGHVMAKSKWQIAILAGPGVIVTAFCVAVFLQYVLRYSDKISFSEALVIGAIVSATDPVSVVALLKELGTSIKFSTLLEGESLLNDGTAYVLFLVCLETVTLGKFDAWASFIKFIQLTFGGPLLGLFVAVIMTYWLKVSKRDGMQTIVITVFSAYLTFIAAEQYLHVSGILALCVLGMYLGEFAATQFNHETKHSLHMVWSFGSFSAETILFLITGTYIGGIFDDLKEYGLSWSDLWKGAIFFLFTNVLRTALLIISMPLLNTTGYKISFKSIIILGYGGLRGAIALSLAMIVMTDTELDQDFRVFCLFYVVITIILTVFVNGTTMKLIMRLTGFLEEKPLKLLLKENLKMRLLKATKARIEEMHTDPKFRGVPWGTVTEMINLRDEEAEILKFYIKYNTLAASKSNRREIGEEEKKRIKERTELKVRSTVRRKLSSLIKMDADKAAKLVTELRLRVYNLIKHEVMEMYDNNECDSSEVYAIKSLCDYCADDLQQKLPLYHKCEGFIISRFIKKFYMTLSEFPLIGNFSKSIVARIIFFEYRTMSAIIKACNHILEDIEVFTEEFEFAESLDQIKDEIETNIADFDEYRHSLVSRMHSLIKMIKVKEAATLLVLSQKSQVKEYGKYGLIDDGFKSEWLEYLYKKIDKIKTIQVEMGESDTGRLTKEAFLFRMHFHIMDYLDDETLNEVAGKLQKDTYTNGRKSYYQKVNRLSRKENKQREFISLNLD